MKMESLEFSTNLGFSGLFIDYIRNYSGVKDFFSGDPRKKNTWKTHFDKLDSEEYSRPQLKGILEKQNKKFVNQKLLKKLLSKLDDPRSAVVITGQQTGLFLGPLYTVYKAVSAVKLAAKLEVEYGRPVVPLFWMEIDDHDFDEVRRFYLLSQKGELKKFDYSDEFEDIAIPIKDRTISSQITGLMDEIAGLFSPTDNVQGALESLRSIYVPGMTFSDVFIRYFRNSFPELPLLFVNPGDGDIKRLAKPFYEKVLLRHKQVKQALLKQSKSLQNKAYRTQVEVNPGNLHLFIIKDKERRRLEMSDVFNKDQLSTEKQHDRVKDFVDDVVESLSPDVLLRPLLQDFLFPTAAYVAGPSEICYLAQLKKLYADLQIVMPVIYPRWSGTVIDEKTNNFLRSKDISLQRFLEGELDDIFNEIVRNSTQSKYEEEFESISAAVAGNLEILKDSAKELDKTLVNLVDQSENKIQYQLNKIYNRFRNSLQAVNKVTVDRSKRAGNILKPQNRLQERVFPVTNFLLRYGNEFPRFIEDSITTETDKHHVIEYR